MEPKVCLPSASAWCAFTDGSCWTGDRVGGWAWVAFCDPEMDPYYSDKGTVKQTTIGVMELMAPTNFLEQLYRDAGPQHVLIFSDSEYVVKGEMDRNRTRNKNKGHWAYLDRIVDRHHSVIFEHVKGHSVSYYNDLADSLARSARKAGLSARRTAA